MKILHVSNGYPPQESGGIQEYLRSMSRSLTLRHKVFIFAREWDYNKNNYLINSRRDGKVIVKTVINNIAYPTDFVSSYKNSTIDEIFEEILKRNKPDLVHFHHFLGLSGNIPDIAKSFKIPYLFTLHDYWFICPCIRLITRNAEICPGSNPQCVIDYYYYHPPEMTNIFSWSPLVLKKLIQLRIKREIKSIFVNFYLNRRFEKQMPRVFIEKLIEDRSNFFRRILNSAKVLIAPSESVKKKYEEFGIYNKKIIVIPHGIDIKELNINNQIKKDNVTFAYLGGLFSFKGVHVLVEAFKKLNNPLATLVIYGDSQLDQQYFRKLKSLIGVSKNIFFKGSYKHKDLTTILSNIDVVVIPSLWSETFNIIAHEAQAARVPIIASNIGALTEIVKNNVNGFLFQPGNVEDLKNQMQTIVKNRKILERFSIQAKEPLSLEDHVSGLENIYFKILQ